MGSSTALEQPARIGIGAYAVPFATDDRHRMEHASRVIGKLAGPCVEDVLERTAWGLNGCRRSLATVCVGVEIAFAPFVEMATRQHRRFAPRNVRDEALPLILQRDQSPRG